MRHLELVFEEFESLGAVFILIRAECESRRRRIGRELKRREGFFCGGRGGSGHRPRSTGAPGDDVPQFSNFLVLVGKKISIAHLFGVAMLAYIVPLAMQLESRVWQFGFFFFF